MTIIAVKGRIEVTRTKVWGYSHHVDRVVVYRMSDRVLNRRARLITLLMSE